MEPFISFVILLIIAVVVSAILHFPLKFYATPGIASFLSKVVVAYVGAFLGTPLFGEWFPGVAYGGVYIIPAILGSIAILIVAVDVGRMLLGKT